MKDRTYTEEEVAALLERAAELQAQAARRGEHRPGLTLSELAAVAAEAGLDPALLQQAASELDDPMPALLRRSGGSTATHVFVERRVPGTLTPEAWEDVVAELRHRFDTDLGKMMGMPTYGVSTTEQIGRSVEWKHTSMSGVETRVLIRPRGEALHVRLSQRVGWGSPLAESVTYASVLAVLAAAMGGAASESGWIALAVLLLVLGALGPLILVADRAWRQKKHRELEGLGDHLVTLLTSPMPAGAAPEQVAMLARGTPLLSTTPLGEDAPPEEDRAAARSRTR